MAIFKWVSPLFLVVFAVLMLRCTSEGACPRNWIHLESLGSCYKFSSDSLNWNAAKSACEALGSKLVSINSRVEQEAIAANVTNNLASKAWIGFYRDPQDYNSWLWVDGSRPGYTNWDPGEPNDLGGEPCAHIYGNWRDWRWNDERCSLSYRYICEVNVSNCPALTVGPLVKTSPNSCVTTQMNLTTNCSFSCPQGYQLQGPSYKQCGVNGQWTDSNKSVSCTAPGIDVQCNRDNMTIIIPKSLLSGSIEYLRLLDTKCKANETSAHFFLTSPLTGCNTTSRHTPTAIIYSNTVFEIPVAVNHNVTRAREIEINFSCSYSKYGVVSSVGWEPSNRKLVFSDEGKGNFTLSLNMFSNSSFVDPYMKDDFPVAVELRTRLFFEVSVTSSDKRLAIKADRCYATPTQDRKNPFKYEFIAERCPNDVTLMYHSAPSVSAQRFSLEAFKFIADHPFVFVHCHVILCNPTDPDSECAKDCSSHDSIARRSVRDHVTEVYSLVQGPLYLVREQQEETLENGLDNRASSPTSLMGLFVACVACVVVNLRDFQ